MLCHCLPEATSLRAIDRTLNHNQTIRLGEMFSTDAKTVLQMTFVEVRQSAHRFIAKEPSQSCPICCSGTTEPVATRRSQLQGWRITCPHCGRPFQDVDHCQRDPAFHPYRAAALRGEKLLDNDAEHGLSTWTSPLELARLLLMRRIPRPLPRNADLWRYRLLGAVIPDLDNVIAKETSFPPSPKRPILPLHIRPALLAGVSMVERAGPEMLKMLRGHTFGHNRNNFTETAERLIAQASGSRTSRQMQLI